MARYLASALLAAALIGAAPGLLLLLAETCWRARAAHLRGLARVHRSETP